MDKIKDIVIKVEALKEKWEYEKAILLLEENIIKYNNDYRLYEELADIYLYRWELGKWLKSIDFDLELNSE